MIQDNLIKLFEDSFRENWEYNALSDYFKDDNFKYKDLSKEIIKLHILFKNCDIKPGDKIALLGRNNTRWCISFLATISYGAVIVPILSDFTVNDAQHIVNHSDSVMLFAGDQFWENMEIQDTPNIRTVVSLTDFGILWSRESAKRVDRCVIDRLFHKKYPHGVSREKFHLPAVPNDSLVQLNYTSGTTGFSKGVMLTANNLAGNMVFGREIHVHFQGSRALSFLPLAHAYGCAFDFLYPLIMGGHVTLLGKIPSPKVLMEAMAVVKPNMIFCVPLIMEKIYKKQILPMLDTSLLRFALRLPLVDTGIYSIIRKKLVDAFGGNFDHVIIGGAALNADVEEFLRKIKFPFTVGYGMTECAPLISYTPPGEFRETSCGRVLQGLMEVRIEDPNPEDGVGEICVRGEHVMMGYYKNEKATADVMLPDGWMRTGDLGTVDADGTIYVRGRSKSMILSSSGQNIYPEEVESKLNNLPGVMESLIIEKHGRLVAMVYPDYEQFDSLEPQNKDRAAIQRVMDQNVIELNKIVAPYERIAQIILFPTEFEKTPKKSIKRYLYTV